MTTKELINVLSTFDEDHEVIIDLGEKSQLGKYLSSIDVSELFRPDKVYEGSNWNIIITIKQ